MQIRMGAGPSLTLLPAVEPEGDGREDHCEGDRCHEGGTRQLSSGTKKSGCSGTRRIDAVPVEIGDAFGGEEGVVDEEVAGEASRRLVEDRDRRRRRGSPACASARMIASPPRRFLIAAVAIVVRGQSALTAMPRPRNSPAKPSTQRLMPYFAIE